MTGVLTTSILNLSIINICLKLVEVRSTGNQIRPFLYIEERLEGISKLVQSEVQVQINIGSAEMISINDLTRMVIDISGKKSIYY